VTGAQVTRTTFGKQVGGLGGLDLEIRTATDEDAESLLRYATRLLGERLPEIFRREAPPTIADEHAFITSRIGPANSTLLLAMADAAVVGVLDFEGGAVSQVAHSGVFGVSVDQDYRGRGIGSALIAALLDWAPRHGVTRVEVQAFANNPRAVDLYHRLGFRDEGVREAAVIVDGNPVDIILMAQLLVAEQALQPDAP
jgi:RimJ/RimL family protein N-acetyltransferase